MRVYFTRSNTLMRLDPLNPGIRSISASAGINAFTTFSFVGKKVSKFLKWSKTPSANTPSDLAQRLHDDLSRRGLLVKLDIAPFSGMLRLTLSTENDAKETAVCAILATDRTAGEGSSSWPTA